MPGGRRRWITGGHCSFALELLPGPPRLNQDRNALPDMRQAVVRVSNGSQSLHPHLAYRVLVEAVHPELADALLAHPICQEELCNPGRGVSINPNWNSILTPQRSVPDVKLGYASTGQSKIMQGEAVGGGPASFGAARSLTLRTRRESAPRDGYRRGGCGSWRGGPRRTRRRRRLHSSRRAAGGRGRPPTRRWCGEQSRSYSTITTFIVPNYILS